MCWDLICPACLKPMDRRGSSLKRVKEEDRRTELRICAEVGVAGRPGLLVLSGPYGLCGRKATLKT